MACFIWARFWSSLQLFCLVHRNIVTRTVLLLCYIWDFLRIALGLPVRTTRSRIAATRAKNFGALGKLFVSDYKDVCRIMQQPQVRGHFVGHFRVLASQLPSFFLLFLSNDASTDPKGARWHKLLRNFLHDKVILPAQKRITSDKRVVFEGYVQEFMQEYFAKGSPTRMVVVWHALNTFVIKYIVHALFGVEPNQAQVQQWREMFFGFSGSYPLSICYAIGRYFQTDRLAENKEAACKLIASSPVLADYEPSPANGNMSREQVAELLLVVGGFAGMLGTKAVVWQVLKQVPNDHPIDFQDDAQVMRALLEAIRLGCPVGEFHVVLPKDETFTVHNKKQMVFPKGTPVCVSIAGATYDDEEFPDPLNFDPNRPNLFSSCINFNAVGFGCPGATQAVLTGGKRECMGRDIFLHICKDVLRAKRTGDFVTDIKGEENVMEKQCLKKVCASENKERNAKEEM